MVACLPLVMDVPCATVPYMCLSRFPPRKTEEPKLLCLQTPYNFVNRAPYTTLQMGGRSYCLLFVLS